MRNTGLRQRGSPSVSMNSLTKPACAFNVSHYVNVYVTGFSAKNFPGKMPESQPLARNPHGKQFSRTYAPTPRFGQVKTQ